MNKKLLSIEQDGFINRLLSFEITLAKNYTFRNLLSPFPGPAANKNISRLYPFIPVGKSRHSFLSGNVRANLIPSPRRLRPHPHSRNEHVQSRRKVGRRQ